MVKWYLRQRLRDMLTRIALFFRACFHDVRKDLGAYAAEELGLPEGFEPPFASLTPPEAVLYGRLRAYCLTCGLELNCLLPHSDMFHLLLRRELMRQLHANIQQYRLDRTI